MTNKEIIIDATGAIVGRLSSFAAKKALQGEKVVIVNSGEAIISGRKADILKDYLHRLRLGRAAQKGPLFSRKPEQILRRAIRGMINRKSSRGREAFKRVKCYVDTPEQYASSNKISIEKKEPTNFITLNELSKLIRQK
ncbi:MAG: 50S ribosomal protein L13 [Candidatus Pacearchaeota archaeon]|nr:50S ribosomal protein L13 [Candidatus Pacearchaeota archaeon]